MGSSRIGAANPPLLALGLPTPSSSSSSSSSSGMPVQRNPNTSVRIAAWRARAIAATGPATRIRASATDRVTCSARAWPSGEAVSPVISSDEQASISSGEERRSLSRPPPSPPSSGLAALDDAAELRGGVTSCHPPSSSSSPSSPSIMASSSPPPSAEERLRIRSRSNFVRRRCSRLLRDASSAMPRRTARAAAQSAGTPGTEPWERWDRMAWRWPRWAAWDSSISDRDDGPVLAFFWAPLIFDRANAKCIPVWLYMQALFLHWVYARRDRRQGGKVGRARPYLLLMTDAMVAMVWFSF